MYFGSGDQPSNFLATINYIATKSKDWRDTTTDRQISDLTDQRRVRRILDRCSALTRRTLSRYFSLPPRDPQAISWAGDYYAYLVSDVGRAEISRLTTATATSRQAHIDRATAALSAALSDYQQQKKAVATEERHLKDLKRRKLIEAQLDRIIRKERAKRNGET